MASDQTRPWPLWRVTASGPLWAWALGLLLAAVGVVCPIVTPLYKGDEESKGNRLAVTAVMEAVKLRLLVHGHYHHRYSAKVGQTKVEGLDRDDQGSGSWLVIEPAMWSRTGLREAS